MAAPAAWVAAGFAFWQIPDYNAPVVLSSDAHSVEDFSHRIHRTLMKSFKTCAPRQGPRPVARPKPAWPSNRDRTRTRMKPLKTRI